MPFVVVLAGDCLDCGNVDESACAVEDINENCFS